MRVRAHFKCLSFSGNCSSFPYVRIGRLFVFTTPTLVALHQSGQRATERRLASEFVLVVTSFSWIVSVDFSAEAGEKMD